MRWNSSHLSKKLFTTYSLQYNFRARERRSVFRREMSGLAFKKALNHFFPGPVSLNGVLNPSETFMTARPSWSFVSGKPVRASWLTRSTSRARKLSGRTKARPLGRLCNSPLMVTKPLLALLETTVCGTPKVFSHCRAVALPSRTSWTQCTNCALV